ncbi:MAG: hypothetical protein GF346_13340 [Candidatus Eisenbacteria bacterium]|nr:hypothetical protein [Candidatus Latescibacterota bacterium]MBD3303424.1 hypothetical protein [Candidatus Eisenbacteria bacterium]
MVRPTRRGPRSSSRCGSTPTSRNRLSRSIWSRTRGRWS